MKEVPYSSIIDRLTSAELSGRYEQARKARALMHAERIEGLADRVEAGETPSDAARVAIQARQWLASRMDPKHWCEKVQQDIRVQDVTKLRLEAVRELMKTPPIKDVTARPEALEQAPEQPTQQEYARDLGAPDNTLAEGVKQPDSAPDPAAEKKGGKPKDSPGKNHYD